METECGRPASGPVYEEILQQIDHTRLHGTLRQRFNVDTWEPAVDAHRPDGPLVGDRCRQCGQPWPCRFLRNLLGSGLIAERAPLHPG
ncbi:hypothetical protein SA2016_0912 [Sinomonas atrocyanea]|uniref:Uncharacterized protein n=1 Tax=Sinomonas atrocyanea TaxID=37927 RepID=A0A126ZWQ4_9MICC|nr:hypothetical protein [Sinomonas atrocyanea]AMM31600.1 hypothetical protein SA2016_0912 [Sinomonas atrocyanea]GEB64260.1 hypothetical protein SAT01_17080 [Sinomonas atrocyanea]GGG57699.1 hypothetical protein GCM10007172_05690 [Sinomonas atrocyanea]